MTKKKRKPAKRTRLGAVIPLGPLKVGLVEIERLRRIQRVDFASYKSLSVAFDEVLEQIRVLSKIGELDLELVHLLEQAHSWVIRGVDRILSTPAPHNVEEARKLLELEFLLRDFEANPSHLKEWARVEPWRRPKKFGFGDLRRREEKRQGLDETKVVAPRDYWITHSVASHPQPLKDQNPAIAHGGWALLSSLGDLLEHAKTVVGVAQRLILSTGGVLPTEFTQLSTAGIAHAWDQMNATLHSHIPPEKFEALRQPRPKNSNLSQGLGTEV
jgi:hypothetical protein